MIVIYNNIIPIKGFDALTIWPFIFVRKDGIYTDKTDRHEHIHGRQQLEMLVFGTMLAVVLFLLGCGWWSLFALPLFYYWYGIEWLARLAIYRNKKTAYKNVSFECEAYDNQGDLVYLDQRKPFAWIKYILKK